MEMEKMKEPEIIENAFSDKISTIKFKLKSNLYLNDFDIEIPKVDFYIVERPMQHTAIIGMDILKKL